MKSKIKRYRMATAFLTLTLGMTPLVPAAAAETTLGAQTVRLLLNTAVSYHYHAEVRRKTTEGACFFDPQKPTTMRCSWRWNDPGADAFRLRTKIKQDTVKWCKQGGGESCIEFYRNGKLRYDGLSPEETQRLEGVLESIPSYDHEATPLREGSTIRAGLFHERFAQMQGYREDWRKKKKSKRHYAMCANEEGTGVEFQMGGASKQLPHVRAMCILQCQAVAQWENTEGRCYTIFENGKFTSTAAQRAMQLKVEPASPEVREAFVGAWKGVNHRGSSIEAVIDDVGPNGKVWGTRCTGYPNGAFAWSTLEADEATFVNGDRVTAMNGNVRMTLMMNVTEGEAAETILTWPNGWQFRMPMQSMSTRGCNERFMLGATAGAGERQADDAPIVGAWSGKWKNGTISELVIESVDHNGALTGRYCQKATWGMQLWDLAADGPFKGTLGKKGKKALMTIPWGEGNRNELEFRLKGTDRVTMKHKERAGTSKQKVTTLRMTRGASEDGCLKRTTQSPPPGQG